MILQAVLFNNSAACFYINFFITLTYCITFYKKSIKKQGIKTLFSYCGADEGTRRAASGKVSTGHFSFPPFRVPQIKKTKPKLCLGFIFLVRMKGLAEPRREKCPLDTFLFLLFESLKSKKQNQSFALVLFFWCG